MFPFLELGISSPIHFSHSGCWPDDYLRFFPVAMYEESVIVALLTHHVLVGVPTTILLYLFI